MRDRVEDCREKVQSVETNQSSWDGRVIRSKESPGKEPVKEMADLAKSCNCKVDGTLFLIDISIVYLRASRCVSSNHSKRGAGCFVKKCGVIVNCVLRVLE